MNNLIDFAVTGHYRQGLTILEVDTRKAKFRGMKWIDLSAWGKRKFENMLTLQVPKEITKIIYI